MSTFTHAVDAYIAAFETATRTSTGEQFVRVRDDAKDVVDDLALHRAVDERLPCDWIYRCAEEIANAFLDYGTVMEAYDAVTREIADGCVDMDSYALGTWYARSGYNRMLCEEAVEEFGTCDGSIDDQIAAGQYLGLTRIAYEVLSQIDEMVSDDE